MTEWLILLRDRRFRAFWLALLCDNLAVWCVTATLPILVAMRFGTGMELVLSLGVRILPKLALAPVAAGVLSRFGPAVVSGLAMGGMAVLVLMMPWCRSFVWLQVIVAATGVMDVFIMPGLLSLRAPLTPPGREMAGNTLCSVADRAAKVAGPALGGLGVAAFGLEAAFGGFAVLTALSALPIAALARVVRPGHRQRTGLLSARGFGRLLLADRQIQGLMIAAMTYMVLLGGLRPFLFWANQDWFGASDTAWTGLLAAQGAGALVGAIVSALAVPRLLQVTSAYTLTLITGVLEGGIHLLLLAAGSSSVAIAILALGGVPEIMSTAAWFTVIQTRLPADQQGAFFSFTAPLWDVCYALGVISAGLHASGVLSLSAYWALVSLTATLPLLPLLWTRDQAGGV